MDLTICWVGDECSSAVWWWARLPIDWTFRTAFTLKGVDLRLMGFVLAISGMTIVLAALALFPGVGMRCGFAIAGVAVEVLGLFTIAFGYKSLQISSSKDGARR